MQIKSLEFNNNVVKDNNSLLNYIRSLFKTATHFVISLQSRPFESSGIIEDIRTRSIMPRAVPCTASYEKEYKKIIIIGDYAYFIHKEKRKRNFYWNNVDNITGQSTIN